MCEVPQVQALADAKSRAATAFVGETGSATPRHNEYTAATRQDCAGGGTAEYEGDGRPAIRTDILADSCNMQITSQTRTGTP
jgi:hypothetical protein